MRGRGLLSVAVGVLLGLVISHALAEEVVEAWRSAPPAFSEPYSVSVNPTDGSCWVADTNNSQVVHLSVAGAELWRSASGEFSYPLSVSVDPTDGSCWVADRNHSQVVHLAATGAELWRSVPPAFLEPHSVSVNPTDGSCWVADRHWGVVHLSAAGAELWRSASGEFNRPLSVSVNPTDGSCWVADTDNGQVVYLSAAGAELWRSAGGAFYCPQSVSVNPADGSCWVADSRHDQVVHLSAAGVELGRSASSAFSYPDAVSVDPTDGSCWVTDHNNRQVVHLSAAGAELWRSASDAFGSPYSVSVNPTDDSCWVADGINSQVVHLSVAGAELWRSDSGALSYPCSVSMNPTDASCWVADLGHSQVVHLSAAGEDLWRSARGAFHFPFSVSANPTDGSCWVADHEHFQVVHLSAAGEELWRSARGAFVATSVSANPTDGSCWVADEGFGGQVVHLSAAGAELWRSAGGAFNYPSSVSVNPTDGSCWVADQNNSQVAHLSAAGAELWRSASGAFDLPLSVSADPTDGSCWVGDAYKGQVVHLSAAGAELWRSASDALYPYSVSVNPADGSCWVGAGGQVVHLSAAGAELWRSAGGAFQYLLSVSMNPADGSCWAADPYNHQVVHLDVVGYGGAPDTVSFSTFESSRSPFAAFAAGTGEANTWRTSLTAHSGLYAMSSEISGLGLTGLRLDLPTEPSGPAEVDLRAWAYVAERTADDTSAFFGFVFSPESLSPTVDPSMGLGWEVSGSASSRYQLAGTTVDASDGLTAGRWHLVQVRYTRASNTLAVWLNGELLSEHAAPLAAGRAPAYLVLGAYGRSEAAHTQVLFDDVQVTLVGYAGPPAVDHPVALVEGPERVAESQTKTYAITYGNGYPMLGLEEVTETLPDTLYVGASLPEGYAFVSADPAPSRVVDGVPVWELPLPTIGRAGLIQLTANTPTGLAEAEVGRLWTWATTDPEAGSVDPPAPPGYTIPLDAVWGLPQDLLPQHIDLVPKPDVWVRKVGPRFASPGDTIGYAITVGNSGEGAAEDIVVRDLMPSAMGGGDRIVGNLAALEPGDTWEGVTSGLLPWGVPGGTLLLNTAYVPTGPMEIAGDNNTSEWTTTVQAARDPNEISVSPTGGTDRGERLTYTLSCENTGAGTAYGVYATAKLDKNLNAATLLTSDPDAVSYDPTSRTLVWEVGTLGAGEGASTTFAVTVTSNAKRARPVVGHATVYFPSVPEETPTNVVVNTVAGTFSDVAWDHWAVLPVELAYENGIVGGYGDGTYRPTVAVSRDQMAVFISRALAGGDSYVPSGPPTATFSDVASSFWAFKYIEYAQSHGVVGGYPDGTYRPAAPVDRGQMAVFVARALAGSDGAVPAPPATPTFPDVTPTSTWAWAQKHVEYTVARGVVSGYPDGLYHPEMGVTRDQMAVFVQRAFELPM